MSAYCKGEIVMNQSSVKKGLTVKDLVTVGVFSALFLVFALSGGEKQKITFASVEMLPTMKRIFDVR